MLLPVTTSIPRSSSVGLKITAPERLPRATTLYRTAVLIAAAPLAALLSAISVRFLRAPRRADGPVPTWRRPLMCRFELQVAAWSIR